MPDSKPNPKRKPSSKSVLQTLDALITRKSPNWRAIAQFLRALGWELDRKGPPRPGSHVRKQFAYGPRICTCLHSAFEIEMGFALGYQAALRSDHPQGPACPHYTPTAGDTRN